MDGVENMVQSDVEEEITLNTAARKKTKIIDSDSEEDMGAPPMLDEPMEIPSTSKDVPNKKKLKRIAVLDDSDDDNYGAPESIQKNGNSDQEDVVDEEDVTPHNKSFPDEETAVKAVVYTANKKGELVVEAPIQPHSLSALCDSESEPELEEELEDNVINTTVQPVIYKGARKKKNGEESVKKMSVQEAAMQKAEIRSESQRMLRERNVSLPYHRPKSHSIREFLQKRSKLASAAPLIPKAPPRIAIKMSKDQLTEISKMVDERIKEVKEFYKSDSEEEEEENDDPSGEIKGWLDELLVSAMNIVEEKNNEFQPNEVEELPEDTPKLSDSLEFDFNLDDVNEEPKKPSLSELLKDKIYIQPRLSGGPDEVIDLEDGVSRISGVKQLAEKYFQHTAKKISHKHKVKFNVLGVNSGGEITTETLSMNVDDEEEPALVETPGAKIKKLKEELEDQMAKKRLEMWKQKHEQGDVVFSEKNLEDEPKEKDILDDEEEYELTETETEDEEEEEDCRPEKPRKKSAFIDAEADEDDEVTEQDGDEEIPDEDDSNDADVEEAPENFQSPKKKVLKRIIKPFNADSDDEEYQSPVPENRRILKYYTTDDEDLLPPNLPKIVNTPKRPQAETNRSEMGFLTPVTFLTGLQNLNSGSKYSKESPNSPFLLPLNPLASQEDSRSQVQKNLFSEQSESSLDSQSNIDDLAKLCSGTFAKTQAEKSLENEVAEDLPSTQDLLNLCSGEFSTIPDTSTGPTISDKPVVRVQLNSNEEVKSLDDEQDQIISQLLDEDELERFKKKFESPLNTSVRQSQVLEELEEAEEVHATGQINSDDEEGLEVKQKKRKKLVFSDEEDDEDEEEEFEEKEEEIDLHASDDEEQQLENEIVQQESYNFKLTDFIDKEAELSESEWGSEDEDEKGLDELELEVGDTEKFNEDKIRSEIEKLQMRQLLDEDNREVKLLQELLLEDGELHGSGRKRQFKWKTLDSADNGEFEKHEDDDIFLDEEDSEEQWRKTRHKREMFLKKKSTEDDDILSDSQILKIKFKQKTFSSQNNTPGSSGEEVKTSITLSSKRGSFLSRSDAVLQRLAEFTKVTTNVGNSAKNSKGFVFQTVGVSEAVAKDNNNKRKAAEATPKILKKMRLDNISPAVGKNNSSKSKSNKAKKLFGNW